MLMIYLSMIDNEEEKLTFAKLYEQLKLPCLHVALKITQNHAMAEDAVHNAFLAVIKHKDKIFNLPCGKRRSTIVIITKNKAIDLLRLENKRTNPNVDDIENDMPSDDIDISESIVNKESFEHLLNCIASLPEIYKSVFELRYVHELSNPEIAEILDITPKNVSARIGRAKLMLREMLDKEGV